MSTLGLRPKETKYFFIDSIWSFDTSYMTLTFQDTGGHQMALHLRYINKTKF